MLFFTGEIFVCIYVWYLQLLKKDGNMTVFLSNSDSFAVLIRYPKTTYQKLFFSAKHDSKREA